MKHFYLAAVCVAALALCSSSASAQGPVRGIVAGNCGTPGGCGSTGVSDTVFSRLAWWKNSSCSTCGPSSNLRSLTNNAAGQPFAGRGFGHGHHAAAPAHNPYPNGTPGTLVFPHHQFIRSPRDFFRVDAK